ncbi:hypothetical protein [Marinobacter sp. F3R11]|uniref:hypothetical protein n=1 Tax=Marinobacter sp. F3R11 TaxID=2267231 RepID=UPI001C9DF167|nr:hypothetical protein [Marinobacter sp. F3R11]
MSRSAIQLAGSSKSVFSAWQSIRKSVDRNSGQRGNHDGDSGARSPSGNSRAG